MTASFEYAVVIPAFNAARTLEDALASVQAQTTAPSAIVVVDDGSSDATAAIASRFAGVTVVRQRNSGPGAATDRGLDLVDAPFVAGLDADDLWFPEKSERQLARLGAEPSLDAVFCRAVSFPHGRAPSRGSASRDLWGRSAMMIRKASAVRIGPVADDDCGRAAGEMIRWLDLGRKKGLRFEMSPEVLVGRRIIEGSLSFNRDPAALLPMIRARLRRPD